MNIDEMPCQKDFRSREKLVPERFRDTTTGPSAAGEFLKTSQNFQNPGTVPTGSPARNEFEPAGLLTGGGPQFLVLPPLRISGS